MKTAQAAAEQAIARHRNKPTAAAPAGAVHIDNDSLTRERDEFSHDTAAWND